MYIRDDFVSNSSSTSYVIISDKDVIAEKLVEKLGIEKDNPLYYGFYDTCNRILQTKYDGLYHYDYFESFQEDILIDTFGEKTAKRVLNAKEAGKKIYMGRITTEYDEYEACLAMDYFSINDDDFFMDATSCIY